ncbi:hypothetical protein LENED_008142 [Lentinula edodes]|uniref:Uncharacterized protein n=1 Tax=Lentinula edodes TaxID=5353 RepID=A0A1Q3EGA9_LENED|nr:hypothetical protein LENED_008142 [Lentinula edodes]
MILRERKRLSLLTGGIGQVYEPRVDIYHMQELGHLRCYSGYSIGSSGLALEISGGFRTRYFFCELTFSFPRDDGACAWHLRPIAWTHYLGQDSSQSLKLHDQRHAAVAWYWFYWLSSMSGQRTFSTWDGRERWENDLRTLH